ncbi:septum formation initiator family protein [Weissella muntiaci]|jgi:cell division protein DivIC|uniref:Septum formation initiator family protein n=1 Tax=Weissella muntiaci TaxID=2508881 RepID=A0A6C2C4K4_9LACO|nr:septum formation initiator family protein [Weissella muntiaci]TYC48523.1 septum formation initiator family protein [Weissella muntiaci]
MAQQSKRQVNIHPLNPEGARELQFQSNLGQAQKTRDTNMHLLRRRFGWVLVLLVVIVGVVSVTNGMRDYTTISAQVTSADKTLDSTKAEGKKLKQQKSDLNNKDYLQKYVREKLMYTKSGELVFSLPNDNS